MECYTRAVRVHPFLVYAHYLHLVLVSSGAVCSHEALAFVVERAKAPTARIPTPSVGHPQRCPSWLTWLPTSLRLVALSGQTSECAWASGGYGRRHQIWMSRC